MFTTFDRQMSAAEPLKQKSELSRLKSKLSKSVSMYDLDVENTRKQHRLEVTQLKSEIRSLQSSLDRESQKDHKIQSLSQQLQSAKQQTSSMNAEYEQVIEKMSKEYDREMQQEISKRIKDSNQMRREISDLKRTLQQQKIFKQNVEREARNTKLELQQQKNSYKLIANLLKKEQQKTCSLKKRILKLSKKKSASTPAPPRNSPRVSDYDAEDENENENENDDEPKKPKHQRIRSLRTRTNSVTVVHDGLQSVIVVTKMNSEELERMPSLEYVTEEDYDYDYDDDENADVMTSNIFLNAELQQLSLKDQEFNGLREKVSRLEEEMRQLRKTHTDYTSTLQQKIGSLQESAAVEHENFMKQKQMLEYKSRTQQRETMNARTRKLVKAHKNDMKSKDEEISALKEHSADKKSQIESLNQNIEFLEQQVRQLSIYQEEVNACEYELANYDEEYNALILQIDDHQQKLNVKELELMDIKTNINRKEVENANLQNVVHQHKETIIKMEELVQKMRLEEQQMEKKANEAQKLRSQLAYITSARGNSPTPPPRVDVDVQSIEEKHQRQMGEMEAKYIAQAQALELEKREMGESKAQLETEALQMKNEFSLLEAAHVRLEVEVEQLNENALCMEQIKIQTLSTFAMEMDRLRNQIRAQNRTLQRVFDKQKK